MKHLFFIFSITICNSVFAQLNTSKIDSLCTIVNDSNKCMGSVCLYKNDKPLYEKAWGMQNNIEGKGLKIDNKNTLQTRFRIGSISKMFTSVMIFQLIEERKLFLTTTLATYFPQVKNASKITIEDLLTHHSGIYNFTTDSTFKDIMFTQKSHTEILDIVKKYKPVFEPGSKAEYSNTNYVLLGYIIEEITKRRYDYELQNRIVNKLKLKNTYYGINVRMEQHEANSFEYDDNIWTAVPETDMSIPHGAGAIVSTPNDLCIFITALFQGKLLTETSLKKMTSLRDNMGYGIFQYPLFDKKVWGHNGRIDEFTSMLVYNPADSMCMALCFNGNNGYSTNNVAIGMASVYYNKPFKIPTFKIEPLDNTLRNAMVGKYSSKEMPLKIELLVINNELHAQASGQAALPLTYKGDGVLEFAPAGIVLEFDMNSKQKFVMKQAGGKYVFSK